MDLFTLAAPVFDLAMKISGHNEVLVELGNRIKKDELKRHSNGNQNQLNLNQPEFKEEQESQKEKSSIKLLDLGGGTGELANHLPKNVEVIVADPSEAMLRKGRQKNFNQQVKFELADGADLPFADQTFDYLTISDALHHFRQVEKALSEASRVLKPGGKLYILEFDPTTFFTKVIIFFEKLVGEPVNFFKAQKLVEMTAETGLKTESEYLNKSLYILSARKPSG